MASASPLSRSAAGFAAERSSIFSSLAAPGVAAVAMKIDDARHSALAAAVETDPVFLSEYAIIVSVDLRDATTASLAASVGELVAKLGGSISMGGARSDGRGVGGVPALRALIDGRRTLIIAACVGEGGALPFLSAVNAAGTAPSTQGSQLLVLSSEIETFHRAVAALVGVPWPHEAKSHGACVQLDTTRPAEACSRLAVPLDGAYSALGGSGRSSAPSSRASTPVLPGAGGLKALLPNGGRRRFYLCALVSPNLCWDATRIHNDLTAAGVPHRSGGYTAITLYEKQTSAIFNNQTFWIEPVDGCASDAATLSPHCCRGLFFVGVSPDRRTLCLVDEAIEWHVTVPTPGVIRLRLGGRVVQGLSHAKPLFLVDAADDSQSQLFLAKPIGDAVVPLEARGAIWTHKESFQAGGPSLVTNRWGGHAESDLDVVSSVLAPSVGHRDPAALPPFEVHSLALLHSRIPPGGSYADASPQGWQFSWRERAAPSNTLLGKLHSCDGPEEWPRLLVVMSPGEFIVGVRVSSTRIGIVVPWCIGFLEVITNKRAVSIGRVSPRTAIRSFPAMSSVQHGNSHILGFCSKIGGLVDSFGIIESTLTAADSKAGSTVASPAAYVPWDQLAPTQAAASDAGSYGIVVRARWDVQRKDVAVKLFKAALFSAKGASAASEVIAAEAKLLRDAADGGANEHIVVVHGLTRGGASAAWREVLGSRLSEVAFPDGTVVGIVMQWVGGGTLADLLFKPGRPQWPAGSMRERIGLLEGIADGLWRLHTPRAYSGRSYIVHGDLKSENVLVAEGAYAGAAPSQPKIIDFGLASMRVASALAEASSVRHADAERGTWRYMVRLECSGGAQVPGANPIHPTPQAPEMFYSSAAAPATAASRRTDVYAFGVLMWEVLSGRRPWHKNALGRPWTPVDRLLALRAGESLDMDALPRDTPLSVITVLRECLSGDASVRPTMSGVLTTIAQARDVLERSHFDIFLSYAWGKEGRRKPLVDALHLSMRNAGLRVWQVRRA